MIRIPALKSLSLVTLLALGLSGCANSRIGNPNDGALLGGAGGALLGGVATRSVGGAVIGGLAGAVVGDAIDGRHCYYSERYHRRVCHR